MASGFSTWRTLELPTLVIQFYLYEYNTFYEIFGYIKSLYLVKVRPVFIHYLSPLYHIDFCLLKGFQNRVVCNNVFYLVEWCYVKGDNIGFPCGDPAGVGKQCPVCPAPREPPHCTHNDRLPLFRTRLFLHSGDLDIIRSISFILNTQVSTRELN